MTDRDEPRRIRAVDRSLMEDVSRRDADPAIGNPTALARTTTIRSYPTNAQSFFACQIMTLLGSESEGATGVLTPTDSVILALNLGTSVPPVGASILTTFVGNRWVFRYD